MNENKITVITIGTTNTNALTESEQAVFYTTLLKRITELKRKGGDKV